MALCRVFGHIYKGIIGKALKINIFK